MARVYLILAAVIACVHGQQSVLKAKCEVKETSGVPEQMISGTVMFEQKTSERKVKVMINLSGFDKNDNENTHGFHVHANGALGNQCKDAGGHYNPYNLYHAAPYNTSRHVGDLGNVEEDNMGRVTTQIEDEVISINTKDDKNNIVGKAIVIHATRDDLGLGGDEGSRTTGNAGARLGCCTIVMDTSAATSIGVSMTTLALTLLAMLLRW